MPCAPAKAALRKLPRQCARISKALCFKVWQWPLLHYECTACPRAAQLHVGAVPLASHCPVHVSQAEADAWHLPPTFGSQPAQWAPHLQQPPRGAAGGVGAGAVQVGAVPLASHCPVHTAQAEADAWHLPPTLG